MLEVLAEKKLSGPTGGSEMIQKSKARLIGVGLCMIASVSISFVFLLSSGRRA